MKIRKSILTGIVLIILLNFPFLSGYNKYMAEAGISIIGLYLFIFWLAFISITIAITRE